MDLTLDTECRHSFIVLAYGESPYLSACIDSLLAQSVPSRIVICTGTPNPYIDAVAAKYGLTVRKNDCHQSIAGDWNYAASQADTEFYTLAHQDDVYYPDYAKTLLSNMDGAIIGFSDYEELVEDHVRRYTVMLNIKRMLLLPFLFKSQLDTPRRKKSVLRFGNAVCCPSVMYNRRLLSGFQFDASYKNALDWDAWLRISELPGAFAYSRRVLMAHRIHAGSETTKQIATSGRTREDNAIIARLWSPRVASLLSKLYSYSQKSNEL